MSENHTAKSNPSTTAVPTKPRVHPNQSHLGLKAFIISASILGTVAGWGVLANQSNASLGQMPQASAVVQSTDSTRSPLGRMSDLLVQNDIPDNMPPIRSQANVRHAKPERYGAASGENAALPPSGRVNRASSVVQAAPSSSSVQGDVLSKQRITSPSSHESTGARSSVPIQPVQPAPVARSRSSR